MVVVDAKDITNTRVDFDKPTPVTYTGNIRRIFSHYNRSENVLKSGTHLYDKKHSQQRHSGFGKFLYGKYRKMISPIWKILSLISSGIGGHIADAKGFVHSWGIVWRSIIGVGTGPRKWVVVICLQFGGSLYKNNGTNCGCPCNKDSVMGLWDVAIEFDEHLLYCPSDMSMSCLDIDGESCVVMMSREIITELLL